ncbi:MAG: C-terminal binding protein [Pirellulales bacterium]
MSPRPHVLLTDYAWADVELERAILAAAGAELVVAPTGDEETLVQLAARHDVAAILTCWARVTARVIAAAPRCRHVARLGIGLDNIDLSYCTSRGIPVTNVPDYCLTEVAEHTLALIFALGRKIAWYHAATKAGRYQLQDGPPLRRLTGQTVGIVGLGGIGRQVAAKASACGFRILVHTRRPPELGGIEFVSLEELLAASDFVTLHVPLTPQTQQLIGARQLELMRPTACLINTARGGLIDPVALAAALAAGKIAGAALDVQAPEPPDLQSPPYNDPRVIVTPHAAFASAESLVDLRRRAAQQVAERLSGGWPPHVVNLPSAAAAK